MMQKKHKLALWLDDDKGYNDCVMLANYVWNKSTDSGDFSIKYKEADDNEAYQSQYWLSRRDSTSIIWAQIKWN